MASSTVVAAVPSNVVSAAPDTEYWWLIHPLQPALSCRVSLQRGSLPSVRTERQQVVPIIGRPDPIVLTDTELLPKITVAMVFLNTPSYQDFLKLRATQDIVLFKGPFPTGAWYVKLGETTQDELDLATLRAYLSGEYLVRYVTLDLQAVAPAGNGYMVPFRYTS